MTHWPSLVDNFVRYPIGYDPNKSPDANLTSISLLEQFQDGGLFGYYPPGADRFQQSGFYLQQQPPSSPPSSSINPLLLYLLLRHLDKKA